MSSVASIKIEQLNLNDEFVKLVKWSVQDGERVEKDQLICSVETTKTVDEIYAPQAGTIHFIITEEGSMVPIGKMIGLIGDSMQEIKAYLLEQSTIKTTSPEKMTEGALKATPKAQALAQQHGIDLAQVARMGVFGTIKEADVMKFLCIPSTLRELVIDEGLVPEYERYVAKKLRATLETTLPMTMDAFLDLTASNNYIEQMKKQEITVSLLHLILAALPKTLVRHERFKMFQVNQRLFTYRQTDIAFIVRTLDGKLFMPVVKGLENMNIDQIAQSTQELAMDANKGRLKPSQLMGACFCVSYIGNKTISRFEAFTDSYQSAMLAVAGPQAGFREVNGKAEPTATTTLTLTYDHSLIDGWMASAFLSDLIQEIERIAQCPPKIT